jgi:hypothetical protein
MFCKNVLICPFFPKNILALEANKIGTPGAILALIRVKNEPHSPSCIAQWVEGHFPGGEAAGA